MAFRYQPLKFPEIILIEAQTIADSRGFFMETYRYADFCTHGIPAAFVQENQSRSIQRVLRGLHYQKHPKAQGKLLRVIHGEILDVAVDIRKGSPTFGQWESVVLSSDNRRMLYIPAGFAHGFCAVSEEVDVVYKVTAEYAPELESGILWNDPDLGIEWPFTNPILSAKDGQLPPLKEADNNFEFGDS